MKNRYNPVLAAVIVLGLVCSLWLNWTRHEIEQQNNTVEMAMEYENLRKLAALEGLPEAEVLQKFKDAGITSLMIFDTNLKRLADNGVIYEATGSELRQAANLGGDLGVFASVPASGMLTDNAVYIAETADSQSFTDTLEDLRLRYGSGRVKMLEGSGRRMAVVYGSPALVPENVYDEPLGLLQAPLGLPRADMKRVADAGFSIIVRPQNYVNVDEAKIDSIFRRIKESGVTSYAYMPCGKEVVGYPDKIEYMGQQMNDNGMQLVMLEHYTQLRFVKIDGLIPLAESVHYNASRSYVIDGAEQKKISVGEALRRWALTDEERNIRVNYIRPFYLSSGGRDLMSINLDYVRDIKKNVAERGYDFGNAGIFSAEPAGEPYSPYFPGKGSLIPVAAAIIAGAVMYLALLTDMQGKYQIGLWLALSAAAAALLLMSRGLLARQLLAFAAAAVFPVLSMNVIFSIWDRRENKEYGTASIIFKGIWQLAFAVALSLIGASFLSAILADSRFLLEIDIYRGVKLTFILPVLLTAVLFMKRYDLLEVAGRGIKRLWERLNGLLDTGITFKHVAVLAVLLFIAYYFVGRSGHTGGVPVPAIELKMRAFLEQVMYARPREKEFMIGHPMFFLAVMAAYKQAPKLCLFVLSCAAVIGQGSLVQTFCHMRTPVFMSFIRALDGYAVGVLFGAAGVVVIAALLPLVMKLKRRYLG